MNKFNSVFTAIKAECEKQKGLAEIHCFEKIALNAGVSILKLPDYLEHLQDSGLIRYSTAEKYIYLTVFGRKQETLIKNESLS
jgi:hypothetical protein